MRVSDHAVLRYLQRQSGLDVEAVRAEIAALVARGVAAGTSLDAGGFTVLAGGLRFVVKNEVIVTTLRCDQPVTPEALR